MFGNDITMCQNHNCPLKMRCYRYTAKPDPHWQSYFMVNPLKVEKGIAKCEYFWDNGK